MFITFEGCDGCGKSTQIRFAKEYLESKGYQVLVTREPGGSIVAERIRDVILSKESIGMTAETEMLLYAAARVQHTQEIVTPALQEGKIVLCDRYVDSTIAYQGCARGLGAERVVRVFEETCGVYPDLTLWLDVPSDEAFKRKGGIDKDDRLESEGFSFHQKVYNGYCEAWKMFPDRIVRVNASGQKADTRRKIEEVLSEKIHV